jgi:hypothetical protein
VFAAQVRTFAGLSKFGDVKAWSDHVLSASTRQQARRAGFILESARQRHASSIRDYLRAQTVGGKIAGGANAFARLLPTWVNRAAFLQANLSAARWSFQHEFMGALVDRGAKSLPALAKSTDAGEASFARILEARGISAADWDKIRATPPEAPEAGATFISPMAVARAHGEELGWRVAELIEREARNAVPEPSLWAQAQLVGNTRPGTVQGELMRSAAAYRSFSVTQTYVWSREFAQRTFDGQPGGMDWRLKAAGQAAPMLAALAFTGALAVWIKDIAKGNDPRPLWDESDPKKGRTRALHFWGQALAQGGGQGILGDFFSSMQARNGKSAAMTALGAPAAFLSDTWNLTVGNANEALSGEDTHAGRELAWYARRYNPLASLWWARAAWDRAVIDQLQKTMDPEAQDDFDRQARKMQRDYGQGQWWPKGSVLPERAPDLAGVTGARQ